MARVRDRHTKIQTSRSEAPGYWIDIATTCIGGFIGLLLSLGCPEIPGMSKWFLPVVFVAISAPLGFFIGVGYKLLYMKPAKEAEDYQRHRDELLGVIVPHISVVRVRDEHALVFRLLSSYATRKVAHILERAEPLRVEEYLFLLEESLQMATQRIFATSLLLPSAWISNSDYKRYLDMQGERKRRIKHLQITRVFVCDEKDFDNDQEKDCLVDLHKKWRIAMGVCDKDKLRRIGTEFCKDFVLFSTDKRKWAVEGGEITPAATMEEMARVRVCCSLEDVENFFMTAIDRIEQRTEWLYRPKG